MPLRGFDTLDWNKGMVRKSLSPEGPSPHCRVFWLVQYCNVVSLVKKKFQRRTKKTKEGGKQAGGRGKGDGNLA
jgi:hypothetical protein